MPDDTPQTVLYQKNFDKDSQHEIEVAMADLMRRITGYCTEVGTTTITESAVVAWVLGNVSRTMQLCKQLYWKYHEDMVLVKDTNLLSPNYGKPLKNEMGEQVRVESAGFRAIKDLERDTTNAFNLNAQLLMERLKLIQEHEIQDIAVKHRLMDRVSEKEPWEREVRSKFFPD